MTDWGLAFDGRTLDERALGGAESAFVWLAEALAARGHAVRAFSRDARPVMHKGVQWAPFEQAPERCDLLIANRGTQALDCCPGARRVVFWLHNPGEYLVKWRYLRRLWRRRPILVFTSAYHATTLPSWVPAGGRQVIPLAVASAFAGAVERPPPPPVAVFTSHPSRSLDKLLRLWADAIHPACPAARLWVFSGGAMRQEAQELPVLDQARAMGPQGVALRGLLPRVELAAELRRARLYLNAGRDKETFCLAAAEAQASGLPGVVLNDGCMPERIIDGVTGTVAQDEQGFAAAALALLQDDGLWQRQHAASLHHPTAIGWNDAAAAFERLAPTL